MKKLKDAIRLCLLKPRKSLNGDNLTAKKGEHLPHPGRYTGQKPPYGS